MNHCVPEWDVGGGDLDAVMHSTDLFSPNKVKWEPPKQTRPDDYFEELCWENGQLLVVTQGQNRKVQRQRHCAVGPSWSVSTVLDSEAAVPTSLEGVAHDVADSSTSNKYMQDDELVSWMQYPLDEPLGNSCAEVLIRMPNPNSTQIWKDHVRREKTAPGEKNDTPSPSLERVSTKDALSRPLSADFAVAENSTGAPAFTSLANSCGGIGTPIQSKVRFPVSNCASFSSGVKGSSATSCFIPNKEIPKLESPVASCQMPPPKLQVGTASDDNPQFGRSGLMNFSQFSRPAATFKANLHAIGMVSRSNGGERLKQLDGVAVEACLSTDSSMESTATSMGFPGTSRHGNQVSVALGSPKKLFTKIMSPPLQDLPSGKEADSFSCKGREFSSSWNSYSASKMAVGTEKGRELCTAWNSCSISNMAMGTERGTVIEALEPCFAGGSLGTEKGTVVEALGHTTTCTLGGPGDSVVKSGKLASGLEKRKVQDIEEPECQIDDPEDELQDLKKPPPTRSTSAKRSRAAEIHNLSERRRRDRINEKMKALQELIPNSNKTDKASLLEEAIEYLKLLQTQLQMMSLRSGLSVSPTLVPPGMQHLQMAQLSTMPHMGMGMGMGIGMMDMTAAVPPRHVLPCASFPGLVIPGSAVSPVCGSTIVPTGSTVSSSAASVPASVLTGTATSVSSQFAPFPLPTMLAGNHQDLQHSNLMDYKTYIAHQQLQVSSQPVNMNMYNTPVIYQCPRQPPAS